MTRKSDSWISNGQGRRPRLRWAFSTEAPLVALAGVHEIGEVVAADASGGLYRIDREGRATSISRAFHALTLLAGDVAGRHVAVVSEDHRRLSFLDAAFAVCWWVELPAAATSLAVEPHGNYCAVGLSNGKTVVYDAAHRRVFHFDAGAALRFLQFTSLRPGLIGSTEFGEVGRWDFEGKLDWSRKLQSTVGDLTFSGNAEEICVAAFREGVKRLDGEGMRLDSYLMEGTANHVSIGFLPQRLAVTTVERHLYWLDEDGDLAWGAELPDEAVAINTDPLADGLTIGFATGRIVCLGWS